MNQLFKNLSDETGTEIIEFAFTIMILLSMTFGMIDFGRYVYANNVVRSAAQEGARAGLVALENVTPAALGKLIALDTDKAAVTSSSNGNTVLVDVTYEFEFITPLLSAGGPIQIDGSASMLKFPS